MLTDQSKISRLDRENILRRKKCAQSKHKYAQLSVAIAKLLLKGNFSTEGTLSRGVEDVCICALSRQSNCDHHESPFLPISPRSIERERERVSEQFVRPSASLPPLQECHGRRLPKCQLECPALLPSQFFSPPSIHPSRLQGQSLKRSKTLEEERPWRRRWPEKAAAASPAARVSPTGAHGLPLGDGLQRRSMLR